MNYGYSENALVETATQQVLEELGWKVRTPGRLCNPNKVLSLKTQYA